MRLTEARQGVHMLKFMDVFGRWDAATLTQLETAELLGVGERSFRRWCRRYGEEGEAGLLDRRIGKASGRRGTAGPDAGRDCSDDAQTVDPWKPHGVVSISGASRRHVRRDSKVVRSTTRRLAGLVGRRADVARARRRWIREQGLLDTTHLVFIDETSVNTNMTRLFGRAPRGERVIGRVPFGAWKTVTFVAALRHDGMTSPTGL